MSAQPLPLTPPTQEYWGSHAIAQRLGTTPETLTRWIRRKGVPIYRRRKPIPGKGAHHQHILFSTERLLTLWELQLCKAYREVVVEREREREQRRAARGGLQPSVKTPKRKAKPAIGELPR